MNFSRANPVAMKGTYLGLFFVALSTLMYEILLTRIFSVTMWYHFAFMAISVTMFGMTVGAVAVYLLPSFFTQERAKFHLALSSLLFSLSIVASFLIYLKIPFTPQKSFAGLLSIGSIYTVVSVPFVFSGICVCLALTKFPLQVSKLYAADLSGAALGCILLIFTLKFTDGPTAVIVVSSLLSFAAFLFSVEGGHKRLVRAALAACLLFASFAAVHTVWVHRQSPLLRLTWVKGGLEKRPIYEKWNSFSRITVHGDPNKPIKPAGFGFSPALSSPRKARQLVMLIDATAATLLTGFDGDLNTQEHLKWDVRNLVHYIRPDAKVLIVGSGGGRDILSALVFRQREVIGVEINEDIIHAVNQRFGDFTGHLDRNPKVTFVNDEARSYIERMDEEVDIIQVSLIDTWAATAAGAFVLSENSLYTVEAWTTLLGHLTPNGVLTFSRWYFQDRPGEMYRLTSLASAALMELGVKNPRDHIFIARCMGGKSPDEPDGTGTILVSRASFSEADLDVLEEVIRKMEFELVLSPRTSIDSTFDSIAFGRDLHAFTANFPINISAPTDDSPFFFHMLRLRDVFNRELHSQGVMSFNMKAVFVLAALIAVVVGLTLLCIIFPLLLTTRRAAFQGTLPLLVFFAGIGLGFMFIEVSLMQKLIIFLGHPTYSLSVVLFSLLISCGLGSHSTRKISSPGLKGSGIVRLLLLLIAVLLFGLLSPYAVAEFRGSTTPVRISIAIVLLFPLGYFMGMAFPLGMKASSIKSGHLTPWFWGVNGATSVCASVLAVGIALSSSISASFWTGFFCYVVAVSAFIWTVRPGSRLRPALP